MKNHYLSSGFSAAAITEDVIGHNYKVNARPVYSKLLYCKRKSYALSISEEHKTRISI
jgi:hypothetical protein